MRILLGLTVVFCLALPVRADDRMAATALIDKATKAMGGEARLAKLQAVTWKAKGIFHSGGKENPLTNENSAQLPDKFRFVMDLGGSGNQIPAVLVMNRERGWIQINGQTSELPQDFHRGLIDCCYAFGLALMPQRLADVGFHLSPAGEVKVNDRPAVGCRVSREGWPDVNLYFDKESGLPVKAETRVKEPETKREVTAELSFSDYKEFDGIKSFTKMTWKWDGKIMLDRELSEIKRVEKLDESVFAKP